MFYIVTGATGHLGNNLVRRLIAEGHQVRALVLEKDDTSFLETLGVQIYRGDVLDTESLQRLFDISETSISYSDVTVVHCAGIISITNKTKANKFMHRVNVEGTKNMLNISWEKYIGHFIYISSVHAIPEPKEDTLITEVDVFTPDAVEGDYAKSKAEATAHVVQAAKYGMNVTIIHPSGIIGPNDFGKSHMTTMMEMYMNGKLNARINGKYDFVDVRDVVGAIYQASVLKKYGTYIISGHQIELKELFETMRVTIGRKQKPAVFARWFVKMFLPLIEHRANRKKQVPLFTKYSLYTLTTNCQFSNAKAREELNYIPRALSVTIHDTALWFVEHDKIKNKSVLNFIRRNKA